MTRIRLSRLFPAAVLLSSGACFATRQDVQVLQQDLNTVRAESARADSLRRTQLDRVLATLRAVNDSLSQVSARVTRFQGDVLGRMQNVDEQLLTIQELTGQSQRRLQELRADLGRRGNAAAAAMTAPATATAGGTPPPAGGGPGPNQLFQIALDQLRRGSAGAARAGFQDLLRQYPDDDNAPEALFYVAETYASEGNTAAADSTYLQVVQRYPAAPRAATSLYKHALVLQQAGNTQGARAALQDVITRYPRSDEASLARDRLRTAR